MTRKAIDRSAVEARDGGVCAQCGLDTARVVRIALHAAAHYADLHGVGTTDWLVRDLLRELSLTRWWMQAHVWEADHIIPHALGGADELPNLRTLCVACHGETSRQFAPVNAKLRRMAAKRANLK